MSTDGDADVIGAREGGNAHTDGTRTQQQTVTTTDSVSSVESKAVQIERPTTNQTGDVAYEQRKNELGETLYHFLRTLDHDGHGHLAGADLKEMADILEAHRKCGFLTHEGEIDYTKLPEPLRTTLRGWDLDGSGGVNLDDLAAASKHHRSLKQSNKRYHWMVPMLVFGLMLSCGVTFIMSFLAAEAAKEIEVGTGGAILTVGGASARIASTEMTVNADGTLVAVATPGRRLSDTAYAPLRTAPAGTSRTLSSVIPDTLFNEMTKMTISDGNTHFSLQITSFSRVMTPSKCGSLVHLYTQLGVAVLDDTILSLDAALSSHVVALGITLDSISAFGRRLATGYEVTGLFSFFEDYEWQCDSIPIPQSPAAPYIVKTVKKSPCPSASQCVSYLAGDLRYPGYIDGEDSVAVEETIATTADFFLSIQRYPNHPFQSLVTLIDHQSKTARTLQILNTNVTHHCVSHDYAIMVDNATDTLNAYFAAYLGHETRSAETFEFPWGNVTIPGRNVRQFRLQPKEDVDGALPIPVDYDDDSTTLLPVRLEFLAANQMKLDVSEILVETLQLNAASDATALRSTVDLECAENGIDGDTVVPLMRSPTTEETYDVNFYARLYSNTDDPTVEYWMRALDVEDNETASSSSRRLLNRRSSRRLINFEGGFEIDLGDQASLEATYKNECLTLTGGVASSASPWSISGELNAGTGCQAGGGFSFAGRVQLSWGRDANKKVNLKVGLWKSEIELVAELYINGYIGGRTFDYTYDCGRRLASVSDVMGIESSSGNETLNVGEDASNFGTTISNEEEGEKSDTVSDEEEGEIFDIDSDDEEGDITEAHDESEELSSNQSKARRLSDRRRRRRRTCTTLGFEIIAGIGLSGEVGVTRRRIGATLEGGLDLVLGPWPAPLDDRAKGSISGKACFKIAVFKGCIGLPTFKLFDVDI